MSEIATPRQVFMQPEVFIGANGHVVIRQEHTTPEGETYSLVLIDPSKAAALCREIELLGGSEDEA